MKNLVIFLVLAVAATVVWAEEPVYFADENLKAAVEAKLGISDPNATDMLGLTSLSAYNRGITDLTGIEYATNLTYMYLHVNQISNVLAVSGLTNLTFLNLNSNNISDISALSGLTNLTILGLTFNNNISDISALSGMTNLTKLELGANNISDISVLSGLTNLTYLQLYNNNISDISALSGLTNLTFLNININNSSDISALSGLSNLTTLGLSSTNVSDFSALSGLTNLHKLILDNNKISDISALSGLTNLTFLNLAFNNISDISALSEMTKLTYLNLHENNISDISALSGMTNLTQLVIRSNNISDISALSGKTKLTDLDIQNNNISNISALSGITNPRFLSLEYNNISDISALSGLTSTQYLYLHYNNISDISALSGLTNLRNLSLFSNPLNCPAYNTYLPLIETNNPGIYLTYDPRPEICDNQPDIDVSPLFYDFGDVNLFSYRTVLLTISNMGNSELTVNSIDFTPDSNNYFAITSAPLLPFIIAPEDSNNIEITFSPTTENIFYATLEISSDDTDEPVVQVDLVGAGVKVAPPVQIAYILDFIDTSVADGNMVGIGSGNSANKKLNALINMFEATNDLIVGEYYDDACGQLTDILKKCDGQVPPPDFVAGEAVEELVERILLLMEDIGCE